MDEIKKIRLLVREMRKLGIKAYSSPDVSLTLTDVAPNPPQRKFKGKESISEGSQSQVEVEKDPYDNLSQEDILLWSASN